MPLRINDLHTLTVHELKDLHRTDLLQETLDEEGTADKALTMIAMSHVNAQPVNR